MSDHTRPTIPTATIPFPAGQARPFGAPARAEPVEPVQTDPPPRTDLEAIAAWISVLTYADMKLLAAGILSEGDGSAETLKSADGMAVVDLADKLHAWATKTGEGGMNEHIAGLSKFLDEITRANPAAVSDVGRRWEAERYLMRNDPLRAALYRVEAIADNRAENQQCAASKLATIADLVRRVIAEHDDKPFRNPLFPA